MDVLLRYLVPGADGADQFNDASLRTDTLIAGSSARAAVQLIGRHVRPEHAAFSIRNGQLEVRGQGGLVTVDGQQQKSCRLAPPATVQIGANRIEVIAPPAGFDAALVIRRDPNARPSDFEAAFRTDLRQTRLSRRGPSWLLLAATVLLGLVLPLSGIFLRQHGAALPSWLPSDALWSSGPLIPSHAAVTRGTCGDCHRQLLVAVANDACRKCHQSVRDHVPIGAGAQSVVFEPHHRALNPTCASCHREHYTDPAHFVPRSDGVCTNCHQLPQQLPGQRRIEAATAFAKGTHPEFTILLLQPAPGSEDNDWQQVPTAIGLSREHSNLKFSHVQHLDPAQVTRPGSNESLGCNDCHKLSVDGQHFLPITMTGTCMMCHRLDFAPGRQLPHGNTKEAISILKDYYVRNAFEPQVPVRRSTRRRTDTQATPTCTDRPYDCGIQQARFEIEDQFTRRGCVSCHQVTDNGASDLLQRFRVTPVRLTSDYFGHARFSHQQHATMGKLTGDDACASCHGARRSASSSDVMIPPMSTCLQCHGSQPARDHVTVRCESCHVYHPAAAPLVTREFER
jgi:hypothetical protein